MTTVDPINLKTSSFEPKEILYNHESFVIASGKWKEGKDDWRDDNLACRWHYDKIGYPNGFGKPQWMQLPGNASNIFKSRNPIVPDEITLRLRGSYRTPKIGCGIKTEAGWHMVTYVYGEADEMVSCIGLGKSGSYPVPLSVIKETNFEDTKTMLSVWHQDKECLWMNNRGVIFWTYLSGFKNCEQKNNGNVFSMTEMIKSMKPFKIKDTDPEISSWSFSKSSGIDLAFCYQLSDMVLLEELPVGTKSESVKEYLDKLMFESLDIDFNTEHKFMGEDEDPKSCPWDTYFGEESYYKLKE